MKKTIVTKPEIAGFVTVGLLIIGTIALFYYSYRLIKWIWQNDILKSFDSLILLISVAAVMQGNSKFVTNLADRVRATTIIDYDYSIVDPLAFINQAKYLGKANAEVDSDGALNPKEFETAENMVIDVRIKDVAKEIFLKEDIVELDQSELETKLLSSVNKVLEKLGVQLNFITLTFNLDTQTREAIDVATAMKIYESKGLSELGKKIMEARAGSNKIIVTSNDKTEDEDK